MALLCLVPTAIEKMLIKNHGNVLRHFLPRRLTDPPAKVHFTMDKIGTIQNYSLTKNLMMPLVEAGFQRGWVKKESHGFRTYIFEILRLRGQDDVVG